MRSWPRYKSYRNTKAAKAANLTRTVDAEIGVAVERAMPHIADGRAVRDMKERCLAWLAGSGDVMSTVTSVIGERSIPFDFDPSIPYAATDGDSVFISSRWFCDNVVPHIVNRDSSAAAVAWGEFKAFSYHELCHILYTPRKTQKPMPQIRDLVTAGNAHIHRAMNVLEDQRIESLFVARYAPAKPLFTHIVSKYIASNLADARRLASTYSDAAELAAASVHPLIYGRRYLPQAVRDASRKALIDYANDKGFTDQRTVEGLVDRLEAVIDEYRALIFPADWLAAITLIEEFAKLLADLGVGIPDTLGPTRHNHTDGKPLSPKDIREDQEVREEQEASGGADSNDDDGDGDGDGGDSSGDTDGGDDGDGAGGPSDGDDADGGGKTTTAHGTSLSGGDDLEDVVREAVKATSDTAEREGRDLGRSIARAVDKAEALQVPSTPETAGRTTSTPTPSMQLQAKSIAQEISVVFNQADDSWISGERTGRLNVGDVMTAQGTHFDVFDAWQEADEEATSFEVVILLDRSASMESPIGGNSGIWTSVMDAADQTMWTIRRAFQSLDIPVTVIGYSDHASMVATASEPASAGAFTSLPTQSSTNPNEALRWARAIFRQSQQTNKLLISLTDGEWSYYADTDSRMKALREQGADTILVTLGHVNVPQENGRYFGHDAKIALKLEEIARLPKILGDTVKRMSRDRRSLV